MKKKRGYTSSSSHGRTLQKRGKSFIHSLEIGNRSHQHFHHHSRLVLWILLTLAVEVFIIAILVAIQIPPFYLGLCLVAFLLVVLLELGFYLRQEHSFHHFKILPKGFIKIHLKERFHGLHRGLYTIHVPTWRIPKIKIPKLHLPLLRVQEKLKVQKKIKQARVVVRTWQ